MKYKLDWYYKYHFYFTGEDGSKIDAGGGADEIYRSQIYPEMTEEEIRKEFGEDNIKKTP